MDQAIFRQYLTSFVGLLPVPLAVRCLEPIALMRCVFI